MTGTLWITGACGFTGRHLAEYVNSLPDRPRVIGISRRTAPTDPPPLDVYEPIDLRDGNAVEAVARRLPPDWVIHLAGCTHTDAADLWESNVGAMLGLGRGLVAAGSRAASVVSIGSAAEYAAASAMPLTETSPLGPVSAYGRTKVAQSLLAQDFSRAFGVPCCVARTFNLVGPHLPGRLVAGRVVSEFARAAADGGAIRLRSVHTSRDFVDVRDAVAAYWLLARHGRDGEIYNVCTGTAVTVSALVGMVAEIAACHPDLQTVDADSSASDPVQVIGSPRKLQDATGWQPRVSLRQSLADMWKSRLDRHDVSEPAGRGA